MAAQLQLTKTPAAKAEMLIRKPVSEVFEAFIDPAITTKFWFTKSSGRLEAGKKITWTWEMYNASGEINVKEIEKDKKILIEWMYNGVLTEVEWNFTQYGKGAAYVSITNSGFGGDGDKVVEDALGSQGGFTWVLAGAKAYLEYGIKLNLIEDAFPKELKKH